MMMGRGPRSSWSSPAYSHRPTFVPSARFVSFSGTTKRPVSTARTPTLPSVRGSRGSNLYVVSDGTPKPYRVRVRPPSFVNLQALETMCVGRMIADVIACIGTIDIVLGEVDR